LDLTLRALCSSLGQGNYPDNYSRVNLTGNSDPSSLLENLASTAESSEFSDFDAASAELLNDAIVRDGLAEHR
jgi:hypothetical protein